jgi:hypothetical protein
LENKDMDKNAAGRDKHTATHRRSYRNVKLLGFVASLVILLALLPSIFPVEAQTAAPYPASQHIFGMSIDWLTWKRQAIGSDNWPLTWADNDQQYASWGDGGGFGATGTEGRVSLGVARIEGNWDNFTGRNVWGGKNTENPAQFGGKSYGIVSVGGRLYKWVSPGSGVENYKEARLAMSSDHGATWTKANWAFTQQEALILPTILQFGRDYAGARDNYVYHYAIRLREATVRMIQKPGAIDLMRVPKDRIMERAQYEFFAGLDSAGNPLWVKDIQARVPVFQDANGVGWNASVIYNAGLGRYLLATEHSATYNGNLGLFDAPQPWGPWTTVGYYTNWESRGSNFFWNFSSKWMSADGKDFTLVFTGTGENDAWNSVRGRFLTTPQPNDGGTPAQLVESLSVFDTTNAAEWSVRTNLQVGVTAYGDRTYTFTKIPPEFLGSEWISTANDSKRIAIDPMANFTLKGAANVYVIHDDRTIPRPAWLSGWSQVPGSVSIGTGSYSIFGKAFGAGSQVVLGADQSGNSFYVVFIKPGQVIEPTPQPEPVGPAVVVNVSPQTPAVGEPVDVAINLRNVESIYGLQAECQVNPAVFAPRSFTNGSIFTANNSLVVGGEVASFNPTDGSWIIAATQLQPSPAFSGDATAFTLGYTLQSSEPSTIECAIIPVDVDGNVVQVEVVANSTLVTPRQPTPQPTATPAITPTAIPVIKQAVSGIVTYQNRVTDAEISVALLDANQAIVQTGTSSEDGTYTLPEVAPGNYTLQFSAPQHITYKRSVSVLTDAQNTIEPVRLLAGDVDNNQTVDLADATLVGANVGISGMDDVAHADLNGDNRIDIIDLVLIGGNYGLVGPIVE